MEKKNENNNVTFKKEEERIENVENMNSSINLREKEKENIVLKENQKKIKKIKIKKLLNYPTSIYAYFLISFGLFFLSCNAAWSQYGSTTISSGFLIIGIIQYILGIYDYYQGNDFLFLQNIIFGIRYIYFFLNYFELNGLKRTKTLFSNMQGIIDFILFAFLSIFTIIVKSEGIIFFIDYFGLTLSTGLFVLSGFAEEYKVVIKINGYISFFCSILFWITGLAYVINDTFKRKLIKYVEPRLK
jgi:succinate-acetate transporter protein